MKEKQIALFDFDGTITHKDSTQEFYKFVYKGSFWFEYYVKNIYFLILIKLNLKSYNQLKLKRLKRIIDYLGSDNFKKKAVEFQKIILPGILKKDAMDKIHEFKEKEIEVVIVSASMNILLDEFCNNLGLKMITNVLELNDKIYSGNFILEKDCNFEEKVNRVCIAYPDIENMYVFAFGDTQGDIAMLKFADESFYRVFKK
ncbi:HAD family hydrolase [Aquimarina sp. 2201CG1-2-11]|uniref:HAD family hydrolase n=1 Tax=Aquimarina discodermiae TaxID=3231043 RepID=UPI003463015C